MLHLYNLKHEKIEGLNKHKDVKVERTLDGIEFLSFLYPFKHAANIKEESYIRTKTNEYLVKEIDDSGDWVNVVARINLDELKGKSVDRIDVTNTRLEDSVNLALVGTGYTAMIYADKDKRRTTRKAKCNVYDILEEIRKVYRLEFRFDTVGKVIHIYNKMGSDKGSYFTDELNLRKLSIKSNTYDFATRIIPIGDNGLDIKSINNGKNYVENHQYSNKIIEIYWEDNRYTVKENLKEDAISKLEEISKTITAYDTEVIDLASISEKYEVLDYNLGDTITLKSREKGIKEKQRIVKLTEYPFEPFRNSCEIANRVLKFEDMQQELMDGAETIENVTNSDGSINGNHIDSIDANKISNLDVEVLKVVNLTVIKADIQNLKVDKADINDLKAAVAKIGTLEVTKATITDLDVVRGKISSLESDRATIIDLKATNAKITVLEADSATVKNLLAGNITSENIQTGAITAGSGIIANGAIGSAQISSLDVVKLNSGILNSSKITIQGSNGRLKIHDNLLQVFSGTSGQFERVALGDINKNGTVFGIRIRGEDGDTVLLDEKGITDKGFTDGYEKLSENSLDPKKIDIAKVVTRINGSTTQIDSTKIQVGNKSLEVELSEQRIKDKKFEDDISSNSTTINANTKQIALKLDTQHFTSFKTNNDNKLTTIGSNLSKATTDISIMQGDISLKASKTEVKTVDDKINNIQIGGTNLLLNTELKDRSRWNRLPTIQNGDTYNFVEQGYGWSTSQIIPFLEKGTYAISVLAKEGINIKSKVRFLIGGTDLTVAKTLTDEWIKISGTITLDTHKENAIVYFLNSDSIGNQNIKFARFKLEKGTIATDWSPAPEDVVSESVSKSTSFTEQKVGEIKVTTDAITQNVTNNSSSIVNKAEKTYVDGKVNTINSEITKVDNKAGSLGTSINGIIGRVSSIEQEVTETNGKINNIDIGTTNLLRNSNFSKGLDYFNTQGTDSLNTITTSIKSLRINLINGTIGVYTDASNSLSIGNNYTASANITLVSGNVDFRIRFDGESESYLPLTKEKTIYSYTTDKLGNNNLIYEFIGTGIIVVEWVKLEKGTIATDWSPAPEDVVSESVSKSTILTNNKIGEIKVTTDAITQNVTNLSTRVATNINNLTGVTGEISMVKEQNSVLETNLNSITGKVINTENNVTAINGNITSLNSRINIAEQKITPTSITTMVEANTTTLVNKNQLKNLDLNGLNLVSNLESQWEYGTLDDLGLPINSTTTKRTKHFTKHEKGKLIISLSQYTGFNVSIFLYTNTSILKSIHPITDYSITIDNLVDGYFKLAITRDSHSHREMNSLTHNQLSQKTQGEWSGLLNLEELRLKVENSDIRTPFSPSPADVSEERIYMKGQIQITQRGVEASATKNEVSTKLGLVYDEMTLRFYNQEGKLYGNTYSFDRNRFQIGNSNTITEHTPEHSIWRHGSNGDYSKASSSGFERFDGVKARSYHHMKKIPKFIVGGVSGPADWIWVPLGSEFNGKDWNVALSISDSMVASSNEATLHRIVLTQYVDGNGVTKKPKFEGGQWHFPIMGYKTMYSHKSDSRSYGSIAGFMIITA